MKENRSLQVAISCLNDGALRLSFLDDLDYLVVHQMTNNQDYSLFQSKLPDNVTYKQVFGAGLSKSRNLLLDEAHADFIWIMDDDVQIDSCAKQYLNRLIEQYSDCALISVSHAKTPLATPLNVKAKKLNCITAASVSSIDMVLQPKALQGVRFNENFGLGAKYPIGEEYIFICDLLRSGAKAIRCNYVCSYHPEASSGSDFFSTTNKLIAKREMFKTALGPYKGMVLYIAFLIKKLPILIRHGKFGVIWRSLLCRQ
ncbi:glycosyltransferase family 2 protein [Vibrio aestuarianus]|uniref:glycosyltransferase family 2 protein n=1 Tax=Vibrio aestuarianus TaxID=28171 RepID=UPI00237CFA13|nr:glycosyltransferase family A protein [Vibrio aestuarianus]MDE1330730.1 glycosyltransferase family 2 protein [Vibrio aestuarianus]